MNDNRLKEEAIKKSLEQLGSIKNQINNPMYDLKKEQTFSVKIDVDESVEHGLFKPNPQIEGAWLTSSQTFRAMKKDIFAMDEKLLELSVPYNCHSCKTDVDQQFWHFCPYCGSQFLS
jgi:lipopolysaccharide biosynthesis regulator YciM